MFHIQAIALNCGSCIRKVSKPIGNQAFVKRQTIAIHVHKIHFIARLSCEREYYSYALYYVYHIVN